MGMFKQTMEKWNLKSLVDRWTASEGDETWPWVWTWRNPNGPHHLFVGINDETLDLCQKLSGASSQNNLTLIVRDMGEIGEAHLKEFYASRCAVIESAPSQIDFENKIL